MVYIYIYSKGFVVLFQGLLKRFVDLDLDFFDQIIKNILNWDFIMIFCTCISRLHSRGFW